MGLRSAFIDFYYGTLEPTLRALERERLSLFSSVIATALLLLLIDGYLLAMRMIPATLPFLILLAVLTGTVVVLIYAQRWNRFVASYKETIIRPLLGAIDSSLAYDPQGRLDETLFRLSGLYDRPPDRYTGSDLITGTIATVPVVCSDLHAQYKTADSRGRTEWHTLFRGTFVMADFPKRFAGSTVVFSDRSEALLGVVGSWLQSLKSAHRQHMTMDDPAFERYFSVYGTDPVEARYLLSTSLMRRLVAFRKEQNRPVSLAFVAGKIFIALSGPDRFEPSLRVSLLSLNNARRLFDDMTLLRDIVQTLKLDNRLWAAAPQDSVP